MKRRNRRARGVRLPIEEQMAERARIERRERRREIREWIYVALVALSLVVSSIALAVSLGAFKG